MKISTSHILLLAQDIKSRAHLTKVLLFFSTIDENLIFKEKVFCDSFQNEVVEKLLKCYVFKDLQFYDLIHSLTLLDMKNTADKLLEFQKHHSDVA